jgi:hypothetical protein
MKPHKIANRKLKITKPKLKLALAPRLPNLARAYEDAVSLSTFAKQRREARLSKVLVGREGFR